MGGKQVLASKYEQNLNVTAKKQKQKSPFLLDISTVPATRMAMKTAQKKYSSFSYIPLPHVKHVPLGWSLKEKENSRSILMLLSLSFASANTL